MIQTLADALADRGYDTLTSVQKEVSAPELADADLLVSAQTGSGKTVGFGLAIAPTLLDENGQMGRAAEPLALVIAPTRELAFQVMRELEWLYAKAGARVVSCVGGMDMRGERRSLDRGAHIVVGTPGRLRDHIMRGSLNMESLRAVVLDEADEMLDLGFREDLEFMLDAAPESRRTLMFSATMPAMIAKLAKQYQRNATRISTLSDSSQHADITYKAMRVAQADAENAIINTLRFHEARNALVFANTRVAVNHLTARLANRGFSVVSLSGELSQTERTHALQAMRDGRASVCVATDVAARGIDLPNLELVIHADLPSNAEGLLHRSGRTGRAGRKGISALIIPPRITKKAERLLRFAKIQAEWTTAPSAKDILTKDKERLLEDPVWDEESNEEQTEFAAKLLEMHGPEKIAAAYLRLYRDRKSAPEELAAPGAMPAPKDHKSFGPSVWYALSVGRDDKAEPRWLLPLMCRAGSLNKDAIGAIRVQDKETFVELTEASSAGFDACLGRNGELEEGVKARKLAGPPEFAGRGPKPSNFKGKPRGPRDDSKPRGGGYKGSSDRRDSKPYQGKSSGAPYQGKSSAAPYKGKPRHDDAGSSDYRKDDKPSGKPRWKSADKPAEGGFERKRGEPNSKKARMGSSNSSGGKPHGKPSGKPHGKPSDKPYGGKPSGKPKGKPSGKPSGAPGGTRPNAANPSARMSKPGKPGGKGPGGPKGGKRKPRAGSGKDAPRRKG